MNLAEILFIARSRLKDLSVKKFSEAELIAACNEGICAMSTVIRQAREDYFLTSVTSAIPTAVKPNGSAVSLPTDFLELKDLMIVTPGFEYIQFAAQDRTTNNFRTALLDGASIGSGSGLLYYDIYATSTIMFAPGLDVTLDVKIDYIQLCPDLFLPTDTPSLIPVKYHNNIPDYVVTEALRSAGDARFSAYRDKLKLSEDSLGIAIQPRQIREAKFVRGFMEDEDS